MIYLFNNQEELIKIINSPSIIALTQTETLTDENILDDRISAEVKALDEELIQEIEYMAVKKRNSDYQYSLYYIVSATTEGTTTELYGVVSGFEELDKTIIEDKRPTNSIPRVAIDVALEGTNWTSGFVGDVPNNSTTFYYLSSLEAIKKICQVWGLEAEFVIEVNGSRIGARYINFYKQLGVNQGKRVVYGHNALKILQESERTGIYTALIGRGKGEQVSDGEENESGQAGYGRRILFDEIEWSIANGDPIDKPLGQKYVELPEATATYGIKTPQGNRPKVGVVEFQQEEDPENLIKLTYRHLIETSRPLASFKTTPAYLDADIGDVVRVVRYDRHMDYETRVFEVVTDRLTNTKVNVKLGDQLTQSAGRQRANLANQISGIISAETDDKLNQLLDYLPSATGKNTNFYGDEEPENPKVNDVWWKPNPEGESKPDWIMRWTGEVWKRLDITSEAIEQQFEEIDRIQQEFIADVEASENAIAELMDDWEEFRDSLDLDIPDVGLIWNIIGDDGRWVYSDNRLFVIGQHENDVTSNTVIMTLEEGEKVFTHNGEGFSIGNEYTFSFANPRFVERPNADVTIQLTPAISHTVSIEVISHHSYYPNFERVTEQSTNVFNKAYYDDVNNGYTVSISSAWYESQVQDFEMSGNEEVAVPIVYKTGTLTVNHNDAEIEVT